MAHNLDDDEFQFRPLTEGLGFHGKKETASPEVATPLSSPISAKASTKASIPSLDTSLELTSPLPRKNETPSVKHQTPVDSTTTTVDEILKTLNHKRRYEFAEKGRAHQQAEETTEVLFQNSKWEFAASMLDLMLVTAGTLLCLIVLLMVTKVDLYANITRPDSAGMVYLSLIALVAGVSWIYLVTNRIFLGFTPGEWVFDQRLGRPEEQTHALYAVKLVARATLVILTGFVIFPILSVALSRDVLGRMLKLELVRKV
jgi:hypothetical protein